MKTIIARFTEVKELFSQGMLTGEDSEGEEININKIDAALKTVGISLKDFLTGSKGIDDIFLELASKWDTLDISTQRYIATIAAGSRQQSRFIAMMQNYDRTMELVNAANNSAGASQKQFEKTQDSLEAKINKLKNAWQEFAMGIANNQLIKGGISLLTNIITVINKLTGSLGDAGSAFARLGLIIGTIKLGRAFTPKAFSWIKGFFTAEGAKAGTEFAKGFESSKASTGIMNSISKIFNKNTYLGKGGMGADLRAYNDALSASSATMNRMNLSVLAFGQALGLTNTQMATATSMTLQGVSAETAAMAVKAGLTDAEIAEALASVGGANADREQAKAALEAAAAAKIEEAAKKGLLTTENLGLLTKARYTLQMLFGNKAARTEAAAILKLGSVQAGQTAATNSATISQLGLNSAMQACPIGWIIAGIAAFVGVMVLADKFIETAAEKTESWEKSLEGAQQAASDAKDAYQGIFDLKSGYEETQTALEELTEGTNEWKQALFEANQEVMELISTYPLLAQYVSRGASGQLTISTEGWDTQISILQQQAANAMSMSLGNQAWLTADSAAQKEANYYKNLYGLQRRDGTYIDPNDQIIIDNLTADLTELYKDNPEAFFPVEQMTKQDFFDFYKRYVQSGKDKEFFTGDDTVKNSKLEDLLWHSGYNFSSDYTPYGIYSSYDPDKQQLYQYDPKLLELANEYDLTASELIGLREATSELVTQQNLLHNQTASTISSMLDLDEQYASSDFAQGVSNLIGDLSADTYRDEVEDRSDQLYKFNFGAEQAIIDLANELINTGQDLTGIITDTTGSKKTYQQVYQVLTGQKADEDWGKNELANQIASYQINQEKTSGAQEIISKLENIGNQDETELVNALINGNTEGLNLKQLSELFSMDTSVQALAETLGYEDIRDKDTDEFTSAAQQLADAFDTDVANLQNTLDEHKAAIEKQTQDNIKQRAAYMKLYKQRDFSDQQAAQGEIRREELYGQSYIDAIDKTMSTFQQFNDEKLLEAGYNSVIDITYKYGVEGLDEVNNLIDSINWSNPIEAASSLQKEIKYGTAATKEYAQSLIDAGNSAFGASAQFEYLIKTEEFKGLNETISDTINEFGELSGSDIYGLVDDCQALQQVMENTGITAEGMAKAITGLETGEIVISQLTDTVLASLKGFDGLSDVIHKTLSEIENFDPGLDENDVSDFMTTAYETVSDNLNKGAVGNSQNKKYLDYLFGPDWRQAVDKESGELVELTGDAYVEAMEHYVGLMEKNQGDMRASFIDLINGVNSAGKELTWNEETQNYKELGNLTVSYDDNGGIVLDGYQGMTTDEVVSQLASAYDVTEQYARMMLTDFSNYSSELMAELNKNDYSAGIEAAYDSLDTSRVRTGTSEHGAARYSERKTIDESEIQAISELYGKEYDEVKSDFINKGALITDLYDEEGIFKQGEELQAELQRISDSSKDPLLNYENDHWLMNLASVSYKNIEDGAGKISEEMTGIKVDYNELLNYLAEQGVPQDQLHQAAQESLASLQESMGDTPVMVEVELENGETETIEITPEMDEGALQQQINQLQKETDWSGMGEAIAAAFTEADITVGVDESSLAELPTAIIEATDNNGEPYYVAVEADQAELEQIASELNLTISNNNGTPWLASTDAKTALLDSTLKTYFASKTFTVKTVASVEGHADGIKKSPNTHLALTGEEGPELVETKDGAYVTGLNGPQMTNIYKGDTVYTAEETERIFDSQKKQMFPSFKGGKRRKSGSTGYSPGWGYNGGGSSGGSSSGSSGGSSSSGSSNNSNNSNNSDNSDVWENSIDKLYNLLRHIEEEIKMRERLERRYEKLLESANVTAKDLVNLSKEQLANLEHQRELQQELISGRTTQINDYLAENSDLRQYAWTETNDRGETVLRIDWDAINSITDQDLGDRVEEYLSTLEDWFDDLESAQDSLDDIEDTIEEIAERGKDEYFDLEDRIKEAVQDMYQEEIDKLSSVNDSINDTNSKLIDAMQSQIDQQRQERDNAKTEQELSDKQRRLEYLRQDTSGANDLEIMRLQKEIDEGYEDYTDTLIDQKISELQKQNDKAAEQRERQIEIAQAQLDNYIESGAIWNDVYALMETGLGPNGVITGSQLENVLQNSDNWSGLSELGRMQWLEELNQQVAQAISYLMTGRQLEYLGVKEGTKITFTTADGKTLTGTADKEGNVIVNGQKYTEVYQNYDGSYVTSENYKESPKPTNTNSNNNNNNNNSNNTNSSQSLAVNGYAKVEKGARFTNNQPINEQVRTSGVISGKKGAFKLLKQSGDNFLIGKDMTAYGITGWMNKKYLTAYKTGGLADFTGPAWLDGTKARPELILNQRDTQNFIQLKNVLASLMDSNSLSSENTGDNTYDIDINVESIGSDYDVEQLAEKVKTMINDTARYRNNNTMSRMR